MSEPYSHYRAKWLKEHPLDRGKYTGPSFMGWSQDSSFLIQINNAILAGYGKDGRKAMLDGPSADRKPRLFAATIADFNTGAFMALINQ